MINTDGLSELLMLASALLSQPENMEINMAAASTQPIGKPVAN